MACDSDIGGPDGLDGGPDRGRKGVDDLLKEYEARMKEVEEMKKHLRGGHESIVASILAIGSPKDERSRDIGVGPVANEGEVIVGQGAEVDGCRGKGKVKCVEEDDVMDYNARVCFVESLRDEIRDRDREINENECENHNLEDIIVQVRHDNGDSDDLSNKVEDEDGAGEEHSDDDLSNEVEDEDGVGEEHSDGDEGESESDEKDSEDSNFRLRDDEALANDSDEDSEDEEDEELGLSDSDGPLEEVKVHDENGCPFFVLGKTYADKAELVKAINSYAIRVGESEDH